MRPYGKIFGAIWRSEDFRALSEDGRSLVLYLLSCEHGSIAGVFRLPDGYAMEDLQWDDANRVRKAFAEVESAGFAKRCERTKWVWVVKHLEWNPPENPNQRIAAAKFVAEVPNSCTWRDEFLMACGAIIGVESPEKSTACDALSAANSNGSQTLSEPLEKGFLTSNSNSNSNSNSKTHSARERATDSPPPDSLPDDSRRPRKPEQTPLPEGFCISNKVRQWAQAQGIKGIDEHFEHFTRKCKSKGYTYADWDAAFISAVMDDWRGGGRRRNERSPPLPTLAKAPDSSGRSSQKPRKKIEVDSDGRIV